MKCLICKHGEVVDGVAVITLNPGTSILVVKDVPAQVCNNCGEEYVAEEVTARLLKKAAALARDGVEVAVCSYVAGVSGPAGSGSSAGTTGYTPAVASGQVD